MAKKKQIKKWSYSRYSCYKDCPYMYEGRYILKLDKFVASPAMERGTMIHAKAENFVNGKIKGLPKELLKFAPEFKALKKEFNKGIGFCEPDISMNYDLTPSNRKKSDWFVGFADFAHFGKEELTVIDYKTGRKYPSHQDQGHAYSMALLAMNPEYEKINVEFWYLDQGEVTEFNHEQKDKDRMFNLWDRRINKMYADKNFRKTPYQWCNSCHRNKKNGGNCSG